MNEIFELLKETSVLNSFFFYLLYLFIFYHCYYSVLNIGFYEFLFFFIIKRINLEFFCEVLLKNRYVFIKDVKSAIISGFKHENLKIPTELLKDFIIDLQMLICFAINLTLIYDVIRLLC
jgi:hypothetical protein